MDASSTSWAFHCSVFRLKSSKESQKLFGEVAALTPTATRKKKVKKKKNNETKKKKKNNETKKKKKKRNKLYIN